ncbi:MAG: thermopsin family protease, partial [Thermoplasmataceae archaeon]
GGSGTTTSNPHSAPPAPSSPVASGSQSQVVSHGKISNVNKLLFLPNAHPNFKYQNGTVTPLYDFAPAPMGLGFFGLQNESGTLVGHNYYTNSFQATLRINNLSVYNLGNDGPSSLTFQLNTVMANTTLFGVANYSFWTQNVVVYSTRTHVISFEDNIWNFSSPTAVMSNNAILNSTGQVYPYPGVHIAIGPSYSLPTPFVVHLYLNTSLVNGNDAVYFNYSIPTIGVSGTYDRVTFNSTPTQSPPANNGPGPNPPAGHAPPYQARISDFLVSGTQPAPNGLLYDGEIMLGGPGGGSTTNVMNIQGTMSLKYIPQANPNAVTHHRPFPQGQQNNVNTAYVSVPSAYDFGTDTGETSVGMAVAWNSAHQAILTPGPSLLYGMWNISGQSQMEEFSGNVAPSNAFLFVSPGNVMSNNYNGYVPLTQSGNYNFWLPMGTYSAEALMSYHNPIVSILTPGENFVLSSNPSTGIYTPLYAENNAQLANISMSGDGTIGNPYMAFNQEYTYISPLFGQLNDFAFPQFEAVMLLNTNQYIAFSGMPSFPIIYSDTYQLYSVFYTGVADNFLGYWFYNASNVVLENSTSITGWYTYNQGGFPEANVVFWNSSGGVLNNDFLSMDSSLLLYNSQVGVWGNYFNNSVLLTYPEFRASWNIWGDPVGISIFGNGSSVVNNFFSVVVPAQSPDYSIYTGNSASYYNIWNLTSEVATSTPEYLYSVGGIGYFPLSGSIVGGPYFGGNYWYNFNGIIPYNDNGLIANGGDYLPLNVIDIPPANSVELAGNTPYVMTDPAFQPYLLNVGEADPSAPMSVVIYLNMTNLTELQTFDSAVNSPLSPSFHQFLTPQQFMSAYYPSQSTISAVESYYSSQGLKVWSYAYAPLAIVVSGTVGQIESAFGVIEFNYYFTYPGAYPSEFMTNTANPYIPAQFNGTILHVYGLSYSTDVLLGGVNQQQVKTGLSGISAVSVPYANNATLTPPNLENYYNVTTLHNMGYTGKGISIGILGVGEAVNMSSVSEFWNTYGIPNPTVHLINLTS